METDTNKGNPYSTFAKELVALERENLNLRKALEREKRKSKAELNKLIRAHGTERKELKGQIKSMLLELDEAYSEIDKQDEEIILLKAGSDSIYG